MKKQHLIKNITKGSIAEEMGIGPGDRLLSIDGEVPADIFDYQFMVMNEYLELLIEKPDGEQWLLEIDKEENEDLGLEFENGLMDEYRSCRNKCMFCFIDQMPPGMRETLYFKDDDSRLSFLQGNYVTLTNMSAEDIDRIIRYRLSPINISFHTTNPELRCRMLGNRFAGEALQLAERLFQDGITMNGQIVLCKGINDGEELERTIRDLSAWLPYLESVSVVPVGLTRYREKLYPLVPFEKEDAVQVLAMIHRWQEELFRKWGTHFIHAGDEWYLLADRELPPAECYDGYLQLENGVGMVRSLLDEFDEAMAAEEDILDKAANNDNEPSTRKEALPSAHEKAAPSAAREYEISVVTGTLVYPYIKQMTERLMNTFQGLQIYLYPITNHFFGERITVSGLLTGQDIVAQLQGKNLGQRLLLPQKVLRSGEAVFLDDFTLQQVEKALQVPVDIVKSSGHSFYDYFSRVLLK